MIIFEYNRKKLLFTFDFLIFFFLTQSLKIFLEKLMIVIRNLGKTKKEYKLS